MKHFLFLLIGISLSHALFAQYVYTIKADSVKLTNCDSSELIIENHTQGVPGFLYNTGNGRTIFKRGVVKLNDSFYLIGGDTLKIPSRSWVQGGNTFGTTGVLGTLDNNHLDFYTNNTQWMRLTNTGNLLLGATSDNGNRVHVAGNMYLTSTDQVGIITAAWNSYNGNKITIGSNTANNPTIVMGLGMIQTHPNAGYFTLTTPASSGNIFTLESGSANGATICSSLRGANAGAILQLTSSAIYNSGGFSPTSGVLTGVRIIGSNGAYLDFNPASGNATYNMLEVDAPLNTSGTYSGIVRGLYYAPLLKSITGVDHRAIETVTGNVMFGTSSGNVIIGSTADNGSKLQVNGSSGFLGDVTQLGGHVTSLGNGLLFNQDGLRPRIFAVGEIEYQSNNFGDQHLFENSVGTAMKGTLVTLDPGPYPSLPDSQLTLKVLGRYNTLGLAVNMLGNTGLGTLYPSAQLHTTGTVRFAGLTSDTTKTRVLVSDASGNLYYRDASTLADNGILSADLASGRAILPSLAINGTINAQRMKLSQAGWPDYVFARGYHLPRLTEIETYIQEHGHLPGIASAAEVEKNGIDVGDHQAALLKKIEELTLYAISQEKKLKAQEQAISELQQQNKELSDLKLEMAELRKLIGK